MALRGVNPRAYLAEHVPSVGDALGVAHENMVADIDDAAAAEVTGQYMLECLFAMAHDLPIDGDVAHDLAAAVVNHWRAKTTPPSEAPWRFRVMRNASRNRIVEALAERMDDGEVRSARFTEFIAAFDEDRAVREDEE